VTSAPTCTWAVESEFPWIHITSITYPDGSPNPGIGSAIVNFTVDRNTVLLAARGDANFAIKVRPNSGNPAFVGVVQGAAAGDFSVSVSPSSVTFVPGGSQEFNVMWTRTGDFDGPITPGLSFSNPTGMTGSFRNNATLLDISTGASAICPGNSTVTVSGRNGAATHNAQVAVTVVGDFSLSLGQGSIGVVQGANASSALLTIGRLQNYGNPIQLSAAGLPTGATLTFGSNNTSGSSSNLVITAAQSTPLGTYPVTISGSGGCLTRSTVANLTVSPSWWAAIEHVLD
jgi:hypothetical protein